MAKVLNSISLDAPAAPVTANVSDTFSFAGTPGFTGTGGVQRYDFKWEVDNGGGYVTIGAAGTGLITADTNPLVNTNSQTQNSITVTCDEAGSYTIRIVGAPTSGGSYTVLSSTQTVEVSAPSGPTPISLAATSTLIPGLSTQFIAGRALAAGAALSASMTKQVNKTLEVAAPLVVGIQRNLYITLAVTSAFGVEMRRGFSIVLAVVSAFGADLGTSYVRLQSLAVSGGSWAAGLVAQFVAGGGETVKAWVLLLMGVGRK